MSPQGMPWGRAVAVAIMRNRAAGAKLYRVALHSWLPSPSGGPTRYWYGVMAIPAVPA